MLKNGEDDIICDLAEYYHIYNYKALPLNTVAVLVFGLRDDSRTKINLSESKLSLDRVLMARLVDGINCLCWQNTADGHKGKNRPQSILEILMGKTDTRDELMVFATPEELENHLKMIHGE